MKARRSIWPAVAAAVVLLATGAPGTAQTPLVVRVATTPIDAGAQPFYAQTMGFFKKVGLNVKIMTLNNGAAVAAAVAGGAADIGQGNLVSLASAHERHIPLVLIAGGNLYVARQHQDAIVVAADSRIRSAHDLSGKVLAISGLKSIQEVGTDAWLEQNGVSDQSVKIVDMPMSSMADAVEHGRVDAAMIAQPQLDAALSSGGVRVLSYALDAISEQFMLGGWFANAQWLRAHPDAARAYRTAMQMSADWANAHQSESAKILTQATGVAVTPTTGRVIYASSLQPAQIQPLIDAAAKYGIIHQDFPATDLTKYVPAGD